MMSPTYLSPGVYVEEVDRGTKPIEAVGTAVAAFVGYTERAMETRDGETTSLLGKPTLVTNWTQFTQKFGAFVPEAYLPDAVYGYFANGGGRCYVVSVKTLGATDDLSLASPAQASLPSGEEKPALEVTAREAGPSGNALRVVVKASEEPESPTFSIEVSLAGQAPETFENLTLSKGAQNVETVVNTRSKLVTAKVVGKVSALPVAGTYALAGGEIKTRAITLQDYQGSVAERKGMGGLEPVGDVTMICAPDLMASQAAGEMDLKAVQAVQQAMINYCDGVKYGFAILDTPPGLMPEEVKKWRQQVNYDSTRAALYYPWIEVADQSGQNGRTRLIPPCGYIAGIYARNDTERGVHKAPANEVVRGALGLEVQVTKGEQDGLNPIGVNCLRAFPGRGIRVWGARTLSSDPAWRYVNVRRLFSMVEESIERGTQWVVFEPNDPNLWARVRRDVTAFLKLVWRSGALFGTTPEQAFYVKCDEETNPPEVRDLGQLIIEVGMAPVKPAEFVIFRISQWAGPSAE
jgi:phage tail sheath protein FI